MLALHNFMCPSTGKDRQTDRQTHTCTYTHLPAAQEQDSVDIPHPQDVFNSCPPPPPNHTLKHTHLLALLFVTSLGVNVRKPWVLSSSSALLPD